MTKENVATVAHTFAATFAAILAIMSMAAITLANNTYPNTHKKKKCKKMANDIQDFDKAMLAEFGCRMCHRARNAHGISHNLNPRPCIWKNVLFSAEQCFNCAPLRQALEQFLTEIR